MRRPGSSETYYEIMRTFAGRLHICSNKKHMTRLVNRKTFENNQKGRQHESHPKAPFFFMKAAHNFPLLYSFGYVR